MWDHTPFRAAIVVSVVVAILLIGITVMVLLRRHTQSRTRDLHNADVEEALFPKEMGRLGHCQKAPPPHVIRLGMLPSERRPSTNETPIINIGIPLPLSSYAQPKPHRMPLRLSQLPFYRSKSSISATIPQLRAPSSALWAPSSESSKRTSFRRTMESSDDQWDSGGGQAGLSPIRYATHFDSGHEAMYIQPMPPISPSLDPFSWRV